MSQPTATPSEQPANDQIIPTTTATPGEQPTQTGEVSEQIAALPLADLMAVLEGRVPAPQGPATEPAASKESTTPEGEQPPGETPPGDATKPDSQPDPHAPKKRLSVRTLPVDQQLEIAQALQMVRDGNATDTFDALTKLRGISQTPPTAATESSQPTAAQQAVPQPQSIEQIEATIADLRAQRKQAKADYDLELEDSLTTQIEDLIANRQEIKSQSLAAQAASVSYEQAYQEAVTELMTAYPDTADDDSTFSQLLDDRITAARVKNDPALQDPRFILKFAEELSKVLNPAATARQPATPPPAAQRQPLGTAVAPSGSPSTRMTVQQARELIATIPLKDLQAVAFTE